MQVETDRRDCYRLRLHPGQAIVKNGQGSTLELRDLSTSGGRLIVRAPGTCRPELPALEIELAGGDTIRPRAEVVRVRSLEPGVFHVGARFHALDEHDIHKLSRFIAREFRRRTSDPARLLDGSRALTVSNPMIIRNLLAQGRAHSPLLEVMDRNLRTGLELRVDAVGFEDGRRVIRAWLVNAPDDRRMPTEPCNFVLGGEGAVTVFEARCLAQRGRDVTLSLPQQVRQSSSRDSRRIQLPEAIEARVAFLHPRFGDAPIAGTIVDVAAGGLGFRAPGAQHGLCPGDRLARVTITLPAGRIEARAVVRSIDDRAAPSSFQCGLELRGFAALADAELWRRFVFTAMHPHLGDGTGQAARAWELLDVSKYADLWTPETARPQIGAAYLRAWQAAHRDVGHSLLYLRDDSAIGMSAGSVIYPRCWLLHHLARDPRADSDDAQAPLRQSHELISGILHRLRGETDLEHFLIYFERGKRWNERLYGDFVSRYFAPDKLELDALDIYRCVTARPLPDVRPVGEPVEVLEETPELLATLAARLALTLSPLERRALALEAASLDLAAFSQACAARGHERGRRVFFARVAGRLAAALIAETGGEGVNIFGLLNTCRLVPLADGPPDATLPPAVRAALLRRVHQHYEAAGKPIFLLFEPPGDCEEGEEDLRTLGFERVSGGLRWIAHRDVIPAWAAYLDGLLAAAPTPPAAAVPTIAALVPQPSATTAAN